MPPTEFDPRLAALHHAGAAEASANSEVTGGDRRSDVLAQVANAVACGLVYVGDQIAALVKQRDPGHLSMPVEWVEHARRVLDGLPTEQADALTLGLGVTYAAPSGETGPLDPERVTLHYPAHATDPSGVTEPPFDRVHARSEAERLLWDKRGLPPEHTEEWIDDVLDVVVRVVGEEAAARRPIRRVEDRIGEVPTEREALADLERDARAVRTLFGGEPGAWKLADRHVPDEAAEPLLRMVDDLNTLDYVRSEHGE